MCRANWSVPSPLPCALNSRGSYIEGPRQDQRERKTSERQRDRQPQAPDGQLPRRKNSRRHLDDEPASNDVSRGDTINLSPAQLSKETAHALTARTIKYDFGTEKGFHTGSTTPRVLRPFRNPRTDSASVFPRRERANGARGKRCDMDAAQQGRRPRTRASSSQSIEPFDYRLSPPGMEPAGSGAT